MRDSQYETETDVLVNRIIYEIVGDILNIPNTSLTNFNQPLYPGSSVTSTNLCNLVPQFSGLWIK